MAAARIPTVVGMPNTFAMRHYKQGRERLLAVCDEELLGRTFKQGRLTLHVSPDFYDGLRIDEEALSLHLSDCTIMNLVGQRTVDLAIRMGYVDPGRVLEIEGVPHAQWALLR